ncbi:HAD family hydrolase [Streptomyces sp. NP160]|uniref:HAD family hydrolase n=1 Tax=Streptomyces sp. NP160 TaxID=2586637 RepID=UPI001C591F42|nr:HAD family hydrolase [Streptomyces sp. NP160]
MSTIPGDDRFAQPVPGQVETTPGDPLDAAADRPPLRVVLLDVNETLSDTSALAAVFEDAGAPGHLAPAWFAGVLRDGLALALHGSCPRFAEVALAGARTALAGAGVDPGRLQDAAVSVVEALGSLPLHPDVVPGLRGLRDRGLRLVPLSQGAAGTTDRLLAAGGAGDLVEGALSVSDAPGGLWKPAPSTYAWALDQVGASPAEALLVAVHPWDLDGAARAGLSTACVDRAGGSPYPDVMAEPDLVVPGLDALADLLR